MVVTAETGGGVAGEGRTQSRMGAHGGSVLRKSQQGGPA